MLVNVRQGLRVFDAKKPRAALIFHTASTAENARCREIRQSANAQAVSSERRATKEKERVWRTCAKTKDGASKRLEVHRREDASAPQVSLENFVKIVSEENQESNRIELITKVFIFVYSGRGNSCCSFPWS